MESNLDPNLVAELLAKRDQLIDAYEKIAISLRAAAVACGEFQALLPRDVGVPPIQIPQQQEIGAVANQRRIRKPHAKDPNAPKKPNTAYILFSNEIRAATKAEFPDLNQKEIVTKIGLKWKELSREQKKVYEDRYFADRERYDEELRAYRAAQGFFESPTETSSNEDNGDHSVLATAMVQSGTTPHFNAGISHMGSTLTSAGPLMTTFSANEQSSLTFATDQTTYLTTNNHQQQSFTVMPDTFPTNLTNTTATVSDGNSVSSKKRNSDEAELNTDATQEPADNQQENGQHEGENVSTRKRRALSKGKKNQEAEPEATDSSVFNVPVTEPDPPAKKTRARRNVTSNGTSAVVPLQEDTTTKRRRGRNAA
ncbi:1757_t:CDS:2 [Ambispora leptoticha]|uniref:1757_t:CDS:1 n=1 Tax=Ambispora leptoticha TaxID=144679 RepID=A0A9N8VCD6_9GLOM|nr:1757_t:CDS:2 [Ambispora leptoticha]